MWMENSTQKLVDPGKKWHVWDRKVTISHHNKVKSFYRKDFVLWKIFDNHREVIGCIIESHLSHNVVETDPVTKFIFRPATWEKKRVPLDLDCLWSWQQVITLMTIQAEAKPFHGNLLLVCWREITDEIMNFAEDTRWRGYNTNKSPWYNGKPTECQWNDKGTKISKLEENPIISFPSRSIPRPTLSNEAMHI